MTFPMFSSKTIHLAETIFSSCGFNKPAYYEANEDLYDYYLQDDDIIAESLDSKRQKRRYVRSLLIFVQSAKNSRKMVTLLVQRHPKVSRATIISLQLFAKDNV
jgi:hypothetical protein